MRDLRIHAAEKNEGSRQEVGGPNRELVRRQGGHSSLGIGDHPPQARDRWVGSGGGGAGQLIHREARQRGGRPILLQLAAGFVQMAPQTLEILLHEFRDLGERHGSDHAKQAVEEGLPNGKNGADGPRPGHAVQHRREFVLRQAETGDCRNALKLSGTWSTVRPMSAPLSFDSVARLPHPGDNVAIALRRLEVGTAVAVGGETVGLKATILEGHRFAALAIERGQALLSWGMPFGYATADIQPGDAICNAQTLQLLAQRDLGGAVLPAAPNFENRVVPYLLDEAAFRPSLQVAPAPDAIAATFLGFPRAGGRGVGIRNHVVILGTSSRTGALAKALAAQLQPFARSLRECDGIVAVAHTEGGGASMPTNRTEILKTLAGFMVNPNVGAVLAVDQGDEPINNRLLQAFMHEQGYPLADTRHRFFTLPADAAAGKAEIERQIKAWAGEAAGEQRVKCPVASLRIGLQCGGSDAFSGISGNPLLGRVGREIIRLGGAVNLAETDELVGAESYVLNKVKDLATARRLLDLIAGFKERLSWHGVTVEGNPSGGNRLRGLYNINLKSLGAAMKKDPEVRLDHAIDYADLMRDPGFYFMNSPGNDLESVAGQVAAGCNLIFFSTGNGSVTNFPFVPTLKVTTTTRRHQLLSNEMDVNAGAYLDGTSMDTLTADMLALVVRVAAGERTKGEKAGHSQVSLWREWRQTSTENLAALKARATPTGRPLALGEPQVAELLPARRPGLKPESLEGFRYGEGITPPHVGLIIPTSMCSSQIARLAAERLNRTLAPATGLHYVALPHSEGCGFAGDTLYAMLKRTFRGYATHPAVGPALFLEHGCEKVPNDAMRHEFAEAGIDPAEFGWASVQLDGGIAAVQNKIEAWFAEAPAGGGGQAPGRSRPAHKSCVALMAEPGFAPPAAEAFGSFAREWVDAGGSVVLAETDPLLASQAFRSQAGLAAGPEGLQPTLLYGQAIEQAGFHVARTESTQWAENLTGLCACGAAAVAALINGRTRPGHPFVPVVAIAEAEAEALRPKIEAALAAHRLPELTDFQLTRGELGVST
jgi:altronate dehydratase